MSVSLPVAGLCLLILFMDVSRTVHSRRNGRVKYITPVNSVVLGDSHVAAPPPSAGNGPAHVHTNLRLPLVDIRVVRAEGKSRVAVEVAVRCAARDVPCKGAAGCRAYEADRRAPNAGLLAA